MDKLIVRVYDVGFGDCIYIQVPDAYKENGETKVEYRHILIDCGSTQKQDSGRPKTDVNKLERALKDIRKTLPEIDGKRCLDLLVVTHLHADHINGFYADRFENVKIRHVWLSVFMDKNHKQAEGAHALSTLAERASALLLERRLHLGGGVPELLLSRLTNEEAISTLQGSLANDSDPGEPLYICRDIADPEQENIWTAKKTREDHKAHFERDTTCFQGFEEKGTRLRVLAPEWNIDHYYLGKRALEYSSLVGHYHESADIEPLLQSYAEWDGHKSFRDIYERDQNKADGELRWPENISRSDFQRLRNSLYYSALRFSQEDDELKNNTSVVLLLEWRGRRLLFTGDAEWGGGYDDKRKHNSCWDVMLKKDGELPQKGCHLRAPLDFLKVGHHGSRNATPWHWHLGYDGEPVAEQDQDQLVLNMILPKEQREQAKIVVSACRTKRYPGVPCDSLVKELSDRGRVMVTNEPGDLNYPQDKPFCVEMKFSAIRGWSL